MSIARIRQITANIKERLHADFRQRASLTEWSTKTLATFIGAAAGEGGDKLQKQAQKISLGLDREAADTDSEAPGAVDSDDPADWIENGSRQVRNSIGSAEALMRGFR